MKNRLLRSGVAALVALLLLGPSNLPVSGGVPAGLLERIQSLPGVVSAVEGSSNLPGTRFFLIQFEQPVNHQNPGGPRFKQRMTLLHRSETAPMALTLSGYEISTAPLQFELTAIFQTNQLYVEHRYFDPSIPNPVTWQHLTIAQAAADHHRIVSAFKSIYDGKWLVTGASKGGMASVYHRFFYPDDVDATVPYVAPSSHGIGDERYIAFVESRGTEECRSKLQALQRRALKKRKKLAKFMTGNFSILGKDRALEFVVIELPYVFWQYGNAANCNTIPGPEASLRAVFEYLRRTGGLDSADDESLLSRQPYYYQASTELGGPGVGDSGLRSLLRFWGEDGPAILPPLGVEKIFRPEVMPEVENWVRTRGQRLLFIYGENDPWSAGAFEVDETNDSYRLVVVGLLGNHGARVLQLPVQSRELALGRLSAWLNLPEIEFSAQRLATDPEMRIDPPPRRELFLR
jgi:hypothetical protein